MTKEKKYKYTVYVHISPSGKYYIGITGGNPEQRWKNGNGYSQNNHFMKSIKKYGWDNFQHEIIADKLSYEEACNFEILLIGKFNTTNRENGYNHSTGGKTSSIGYARTAEYKHKISESTRGKKKTKEHVLKLSRIVICITTEEIFTSMKDASDKYKVSFSHISHCCSGKRKTAGKHPETGEKLIWMYYEDYIIKSKEEIEEIIKFATTNNMARKIICLTTDEIFDCIMDAERKYGIRNSKICDSWKSKGGKSAGKLLDNTKLYWMYYEEYEVNLKTI